MLRYSKVLCLHSRHLLRLLDYTLMYLDLKRYLAEIEAFKELVTVSDRILVGYGIRIRSDLVR